MKRWHVALLLVAACSASAAAGFWAGFREAWLLGSAADLVPRAARSVSYLEALQAGKLRPVTLGLEFDVDNALNWGFELSTHPLRELWAPLWGFDVFPGYERHFVRLARYRRDHPSSTSADMFDSVPESRPDLADTYRELARSGREVAARRDAMVRRYAGKSAP